MNKILSTFQQTFEKKPALTSFLLITGVLLVFYSNSFSTDWHYDDFHHIKENINIRKITNIPLFFKDPTTFSRNPQTRMYRPLLMTTHAINYWLGIKLTRDGYNVVGYHVFNFLFHVVSTFFIFLITFFFFRYRCRVEGLAPHLPASFAALLFGLHTINTETVVYVSSRSSVMATAFYLMAFYGYLISTRDKKTRWPLLTISSFGLFLGLISKEIAITLPAILVYYEIFFQWRASYADLSYGEKIKTSIIRILPFGLVSLVYLLIRKVVFGGESLVAKLVKAGGTYATPNLKAQIATQSRAWVYYIREFLWPTGLSIDKPFQVSRGFNEGAVIFSVVFIILIVIAAVMSNRRQPVFTFGVLWFFTALLPTSLFRLNVVINDHRLYLPGVGAVLIFSYLAAKLYIRFRADGGLYYKGFVSLCLAILIFMGLGTFKRNMAFATEESMWKDVILKDRKSVRGYNNLGIYYEQHKEFDKALAHYQQTIKLAPLFPNPYINIGNVYHKKKEYEKAEQWMKRALQLDPRSALASYNLGNILREAGKTQEAVVAYGKALQLNPRYIEAANNLANIYFKMMNYPEAIKYYQQALFIDPTFAMSYYNIGLANERLGRPQEALASYKQFLRFWLGDKKYIAIANEKIRLLERSP